MLSIVLFSLLMGGPARAKASERWMRIANPAALKCEARIADQFTTYFVVSVEDKRVFEYPYAGPSTPKKMSYACTAAKIQATSEGKAVFLNLENGEVIPQDGFFVYAAPGQPQRP